MKKIVLLIVCLGFIPAVFGDTPDPAPPKEEKEEVELQVPDLLKREQEGKTLTAHMHFVLGKDAYTKGDMEEAARRWEIAALSGGSPEAYYNWGTALYGLAMPKKDEALFQEAFDKYAEAVRIKPGYPEAYNNWGLALSVLAGMKGDEALFRQAFEKYAEAIRIEPDLYQAHYNWVVALRACAKIVEDETERDALLKQSEEKIEKTMELQAAKNKAGEIKKRE